MKKLILMLTMAVVAGSMMTSPLSAQELTVDDIVNKANLVSYYSGDDGLSDVTMTITDSQGRTRNREFRILRYDQEDGGKQKFYVYFKEPSDVARMVYMVWKRVGEDDDRWLYLPALDLVRRIAASDKRSSFVGSHFVYEDVSGRGVEADRHELVETTDEFYVVRNVPKDPDNVEFADYTVWIRKYNFLPVKAEYRDARGEVIRTIEALEFEDVQGFPTVTRSKATDLERGGETLMEFKNIEYNVGLGEDIFEERYLRRPPTQWVR